MEIRRDEHPHGGGLASTRPYRMTARADAVEQTRERILHVTYQLWLDRSYDELTVDAIAAAAEVSRQTVHRHFGSKDDLVLAVMAWLGPREEAARAVEVGDTEAAVRRVVERNEETGDADLRALELEGRVATVERMLAEGRRSHRQWVEQAFDPYLPRPSARRDRVVDALYAATDVTVWKLLRRDFGRTAAETEAIIRLLVDGALGGARQAPGKESE